MKTKRGKVRTYSLDTIKDKMIGKSGTPVRDRYEFELSLEILGETIRTTRLHRNLTQEQLGELIGVQKAQISKLEKSANNVTIETILRVFQALRARVNFKIELEKKKLLQA